MSWPPWFVFPFSSFGRKVHVPSSQMQPYTVRHDQLFHRRPISPLSSKIEPPHISAGLQQIRLDLVRNGFQPPWLGLLRPSLFLLYGYFVVLLLLRWERRET